MQPHWEIEYRVTDLERSVTRVIGKIEYVEQPDPYRINDDDMEHFWSAVYIRPDRFRITEKCDSLEDAQRWVEAQYNKEEAFP